jgi:hypothetical protein
MRSPTNEIEAQQLRTNDPKNEATSSAEFGFSRSPSVLAKSAQVSRIRVRGKTIVYENRTKSAQSGGLETNGPSERISDLSRRGVVRRFSGEARGYWASIRSRKPAENVGRGRTGGGSGIRTLNLDRTK